MAWSLGSVVIHPGEKGDSREVTSLYGIQKVLGATQEVKSYYGAQSERRTLNFILFEDDNANAGLNSLITATDTDANVNLTSDQGSQGNWRILKIKASRRIDTNHTYPTYECSVELISAA